MSRSLNSSLHDDVVGWLATKEGGICNHTTMQFSFEGRVPDVVKLVNSDPIELIEVEAVHKDELPPIAKRTLSFLVQGKWDKYQVIQVNPLKTEQVSNLILLEQQLLLSIQSLKGKEKALTDKVTSLRKEYIQLLKKAKP